MVLDSWFGRGGWKVWVFCLSYLSGVVIISLLNLSIWLLVVIVLGVLLGDVDFLYIFDICVLYWILVLLIVGFVIFFRILW